MKSRKKRRHYIFIIGIIVLIVCAAFSLINVFVKTDRDNIDVSPLATNQILNGDIKNAMKEINADTFLVISYTNDQVVHKNEKEIEKYLKKVNLLDNVMYLDLKDYVNDADYLKNINKAIGLKGENAIEKLPAVIFYKDGSFVKMVDSRKNTLNVDVFKKYIQDSGLAS
jgi:hypothetical protein